MGSLTPSADTVFEIGPISKVFTGILSGKENGYIPNAVRFTSSATCLLKLGGEGTCLAIKARRLGVRTGFLTQEGCDGWGSFRLLQDILLQIWRSLCSFEKRSSIDTWCYRIALDTAISWRRSVGKRKLRFPPDDTDIGLVPGSDDGRDSSELLRQFLHTLSDADRALVLMYLEDMSGTEMAQILGVGAGALRVRIHRIKQRLAKWEAGDL